MKREFTYKMVSLYCGVIIVCLGDFTDSSPYSFTVDRGDGEILQLLYSKDQDRFY